VEINECRETKTTTTINFLFVAFAPEPTLFLLKIPDKQKRKRKNDDRFCFFFRKNKAKCAKEAGGGVFFYAIPRKSATMRQTSKHIVVCSVIRPIAAVLKHPPHKYW